MSREYAFPLLAAGMTLLALVMAVVPFEPMAAELAASGVARRIAAMLSAFELAAALALLSGAALWHAPRSPWSRLATAAVLGLVCGLVIVMLAPEWVASETGPLLAAVKK